MASTQSGLKEYHLGVLILIIASELGSSMPMTTSTPKATKCAEFLSKNITGTLPNTRQRKQNFSTVEISQSSTTATSFSSIGVENQKNASDTNLGRYECSRERKNDCPRFVDKYSSFYLKVGVINVY